MLRHAIPSDKRIREIWLQRINNEKLFGIDDSRVLKNYTVCAIHFEDVCKDISAKKLKKYSLPTLHLPGRARHFSHMSVSNKNIICILEYASEGVEENCFSLPQSPKYKIVTPGKLRGNYMLQCYL